MTAELRRRGMPVNHNRVWRMMREDNLLAVQPGGNPIGQEGSNGVREVQGGVSDAQAMFDNLSQGGTVVAGSNYPGTLVTLQNGGTVGFRTVMTNSPGTAATIDVNVPIIPFTKIKFNP